MRNIAVIFSQLIVILCFVAEISSKFEFTNLKCTTFDEAFSDFEYCYIKAVNRSYKYVSVKCKLYKLPVTKAKINIILFKRLNGYKPFMYNVTADACRFLRDVNTNPILKYFYKFLEAYSNMNHTCPYNHDVKIEKLPTDLINHQVTTVLPFPVGDYMLETHWIAYDIKRATVQFYGTIS